MPSLCLYFKVHQPFQLKQYQPEDIDVQHCYEDSAADKLAIDTLADTCWLPANSMIHALILSTKGKFKVSYSISGTSLELMQRYRPDVIRSFRELVATGCVEILAETYYHSLSYLYSPEEFKRQVEQHRVLVQQLFGTETRLFRNTELIYNNELAGLIEDMGFDGILCEGVRHNLGGRSCNHLYTAAGDSRITLLLRNSTLSDDIAFRFGDRNWSGHPLTAEKFGNWIHAHPIGTDLINLFFDYETFGIHKPAHTGIFQFLEALPQAVLANPSFEFSLPAEVLDKYKPAGIYDARETISWQDKSEALGAWGRNLLQNNTFKKIYSLEKMVLLSGDKEALDSWGKLQTADYFYYMADNLHPFHSSKEVYRFYTNIVADLEISLIRKAIGRRKKKFRLEPGIY